MIGHSNIKLGSSFVMLGLPSFLPRSPFSVRTDLAPVTREEPLRAGATEAQTVPSLSSLPLPLPRLVTTTCCLQCLVTPGGAICPPPRSVTLDMAQFPDLLLTFPAKATLSGSMTLTAHRPFISIPIFSFLHNGKILKVLSDHVLKKMEKRVVKLFFLIWIFDQKL